MKEGWEYKKLDDICYSVEDGDWIESKDQSPNGIRLIQTGNIGNGCYKDKQDSAKYISEETFKRLHCTEIFKGDILVSRLPDPVGRACILPDLGCRCITAVDCSILRIRKNLACNAWITYFMQSQAYFSIIKAQCTGSTRLRITRKKLAEILVPVPPLSEQQSIVDYLDSAFAKIDAMKANAEKSLNEAKALFQASLKEMLEPKEGWEVATIGKLGDIFGRIGFRGYTKSDLVAGPDEGAITLSPSNIQDGSMDYTSCTYISWFKYKESPEIMINNGDVLIVKTGSSYGKSAFVENLPHKATINPQSVVIKNIKIKNKFFAYLIRTPWVKAKFDEFVSGTAIPTFSQAKLSQVELSYPSNDMQNIICEKLDSLKSKVDRLQENYDKISLECDGLKQAILRQVFE